MKEREKTPRGSGDTTDITDTRRMPLPRRSKLQNSQESPQRMMIRSPRRFLYGEEGGLLSKKMLPRSR